MVIKTVPISKSRLPRLPALLREVASPPGVAAQARRSAAAAASPLARSPTGARSKRRAPHGPHAPHAPHAPHGPHASHAHSAGAIVVCASSASVSLHLHDARLKREAGSEAGDVIDLGSPRQLRRKAPEALKPGRAAKPRCHYIPNPRLYPGSRKKQKPRPTSAEAGGNTGRGRRHKQVFSRPVPNSRLYRPTPPRPPPPPARPLTTWRAPSPNARLETASRVALRLSEQWRGPRALPHTRRAPRLVRAGRSLARATRSPVRATRSPVRATRSPVRATRSPVRTTRSPVLATRSPVRARRSPVRATQTSQPAACSSSPSRRLVVTLPAPPRYWPASEHFRLRSLDTESGASTPAAALAAAAPRAVPAMDASNRHSTSPEDCSEGNETLSAPSEFLAEFLSAIMRRQYAEALKYCRLILQYEPHNATARGFYPLLQHKVQAHKRAAEGGAAGGWARGSSSEEASVHVAPPAQEMMEQGADSSDGSAPASRGASRSSSRSRGSCASQSSLELDSSDALAHSSPSLSLSRRTERSDSDGPPAGCCESTGSEPDDNGNAPPACAADLHNDNAAHSKADPAAALRRLRAQFTCSIK